MKKLIIVVAFLLSQIPSAAAGNFATEMMGATFKLFHPHSTSTCFLLRSDTSNLSYYLVTAAHALDKTTGQTATLVLRRELQDGTYARHDCEVQLRKDGQALWHRHKVHDVAVLKLAEPLPVAVPALPLTCLADRNQLKVADVHLCSHLFVLTYPERFEANAAGLPVARQGIFSSPPTLPSDVHPTFLADFTTFAGDSGGPVFLPTGDNETPLVVGVVLGRYQHDERIETKYEKRLIRHPFGLGIVLHARYIREVVDSIPASE